MDIPERIAKKLSRAGVASRRKSEELIRSGKVSINTNTVLDPSVKVRASDEIKVFGKAIRRVEPTRVWRYFKPTGLVTTDSDESGRETIFDKLPKELPRLMSIGRLDISSEGLLLLTNDGTLKRKLELPSTGLLRKYRVRARGIHCEKSLDRLRKGMIIAKESFRPMSISVDTGQGANRWYTVGLTEGRNREIRRTFTEINLQVNRLIRISFGPFQLANLSTGEIREVDPISLKKNLDSIVKSKK